MITQCHKQVKEEITATVKHLPLHSSAAFERVAAADNQRKIVSSKLGVGVGGVGVGVSGGGQDCTGHSSAFCMYA